MTFRIRMHGAPLLAALVLLLAACTEDPTGVGIELIDPQAGEPVVRQLPVASIGATTTEDITGNAGRFLAGRAIDDDVLAYAFIDVVAIPPSTFRDAALESVTLELAPDYVFGDTLSTITLELRELEEEFVAAGARADTTLPVGASIQTFSFEPGDTLVTVALNPAWVARNDTTFRSDAFASSFHGFQIRGRSARAVVGFDPQRSALVAVAGGDTTRLPFATQSTAKFVTTLERDDAPMPPAGLLRVQDGVGDALTLDLAATLDTQSIALNRAAIRVFADTAAVQAMAPAGHARPLLDRLQLLGVDAAGTRFVLAEAELKDGAFVFESLTLTSELQRLTLGTSLLSSYEVAAPASRNTIDPMLIYDASAGALAPEMAITLSELN